MIASFFIKDTYGGSPTDPLSLNLYTYCLQNPLAYYDPTGHKPQGVVFGYGSNNTQDIEILQRMLVDKGFLTMPKGVSYGYFGDLTKSAVSAFQRSLVNRKVAGWRGSDIDSKVGDKTWGALGLYLEDTADYMNVMQQYSGILGRTANVSRQAPEGYYWYENTLYKEIRDRTTGEVIGDSIVELVPFLASSMGQHPYSRVPLTHEELDSATTGDMMFVISSGGGILKLAKKALGTLGKEVLDDQITRVGQWMSKAEYEQFIKTNRIPRTNVLTKGKEGYMRQANSGDYYVEFDINSSLLVEKDIANGWSLIKSKNDLYLKLAEKKGQVLPDPIGSNIVHVTTK